MEIKGRAAGGDWTSVPLLGALVDDGPAQA
jgi:hypothetical protein